jgi:hypothetical protein
MVEIVHKFAFCYRYDNAITYILLTAVGTVNVHLRSIISKIPQCSVVLEQHVVLDI